MTHLKFRQFPIQLILRTSRPLLRHYNNFAIPADFDTGDAHTGRRHGFHGPGHIRLPE
jgi:hypothetical protein